MKRRVLYFTAPFRMEIREEPLPPLQPDEILVQTLVSAISPGTEMLLYRGQMPVDVPVDETIDALSGQTMAYPLKYGYAAVGRVVERGQDVDPDWQDRLLFAFNPHESHFVCRTQEALPLPEDMTAETAVFLPNMETAVSFLMDGRPVIGEQVAVFGQGIVGLLVTALLAAYPLASLVTLDRYRLRRDWSRKLGADASLDPTQPEAKDRLQAALSTADQYTGADLTFELSGNPEALQMAIEATGFNGRLFIGSWYGQKQAYLNLGGHFHRSQMQIISSQVSHLAPRWRGRWTKARRLAVAWAALRRHRPDRLITHRFPLADAAQAYQLLHDAPETAVQPLIIYE